MFGCTPRVNGGCAGEAEVALGIEAERVEVVGAVEILRVEAAGHQTDARFVALGWFLTGAPSRALLGVTVGF